MRTLFWIAVSYALLEWIRARRVKRHNARAFERTFGVGAGLDPNEKTLEHKQYKPLIWPW